MAIVVDVLHNDGEDLLGLHGDHGREWEPLQDLVNNGCCRTMVQTRAKSGVGQLGRVVVLVLHGEGRVDDRGVASG